MAPRPEERSAPGGADASDRAAQHGGSAEAQGGNSGSSPNRRLLNTGAVQNPQHANLGGGGGGDGGDTEAFAGNGGHGNEQFPAGGNGTLVSAQGGDGGAAVLSGGNGGRGWQACPPLKPGRDGGQGANLRGRSGRGASGRVDGVHRGSILYEVGNGGDPGHGAPAGQFGNPGLNQHTVEGPETRAGRVRHRGELGLPCVRTRVLAVQVTFPAGRVCGGGVMAMHDLEIISVTRVPVQYEVRVDRLSLFALPLTGQFGMPLVNWQWPMILSAEGTHWVRLLLACHHEFASFEGRFTVIVRLDGRSFEIVIPVRGIPQ